jgi:hypothetical protein
MAELFSSNTCRHRRRKAGEQLRSYSASIRISYRQRHAESRRCTVSLAKLPAGVISSKHEASILPWRIDARPRGGSPHSYKLFDTANPNL